MLLYVARPPELVESRLVGRDRLQEVCIPLTGRPVIGVVFLSPSSRPPRRPPRRPSCRCRSSSARSSRLVVCCRRCRPPLSVMSVRPYVHWPWRSLLVPFQTMQAAVIDHYDAPTFPLNPIQMKESLSKWPVPSAPPQLLDQVLEGGAVPE